MKPGMVAALEVSADLLLASGDARPAVRLLRVADSQREILGLPRLRIDRDHHDRQLAQAKQALGGEAFELAWNEGRSVTLDAAAASILAPD